MILLKPLFLVDFLGFVRFTLLHRPPAHKGTFVHDHFLPLFVPSLRPHFGVVKT